MGQAGGIDLAIRAETGLIPIYSEVPPVVHGDNPMKMIWPAISISHYGGLFLCIPKNNHGLQIPVFKSTEEG